MMPPMPGPPITGVILAGGASSRMGRNKALLPCDGTVFIEKIHDVLAGLFPEVLVVTNDPAAFDFLPCRKVPDLIPGAGALAGLHSGLAHASGDWIFAVACDMPWIDPLVVTSLAGLRDGWDAVVPESEGGLEPLHSLYSRDCLSPVEEMLRSGERKILSFLSRVRSRIVSVGDIRLLDPGFRSFRNVNTPDEFRNLVP